MVTIADLDAIIAKFVSRGFNDIVASMDHNDVCDAIKVIRDLIASLGAGAGIEGSTHVKIEVLGENVIAIPAGTIKFRSLGSIKIGKSLMEYLNYWMNIQAELRCNPIYTGSRVCWSIHKTDHPTNEEINQWFTELSDYVWDDGLVGWETSYELKYSSYLNNSRVGTDQDVYLVLWFGADNSYGSDMTAYARNMKGHLPVFCHVV